MHTSEEKKQMINEELKNAYAIEENRREITVATRAYADLPKKTLKKAMVHHALIARAYGRIAQPKTMGWQSYLYMIGIDRLRQKTEENNEWWYKCFELATGKSYRIPKIK